MFVIGNFIGAVAYLLDWALSAYFWIIVIRALLSWVNPDPWNPIVQFLIRATEPVLAPIRRRLPTWRTGFDLSPVIVVLAIWFVRLWIVGSLKEFAWRIR